MVSKAFHRVVCPNLWRSIRIRGGEWRHGSYSKFEKPTGLSQGSHEVLPYVAHIRRLYIMIGDLAPEQTHETIDLAQSPDSLVLSELRCLGSLLQNLPHLRVLQLRVREALGHQRAFYHQDLVIDELCRQPFPFRLEMFSCSMDIQSPFLAPLWAAQPQLKGIRALSNAYDRDHEPHIDAGLPLPELDTAIVRNSRETRIIRGCPVARLAITDTSNIGIRKIYSNISHTTSTITHFLFRLDVDKQKDAKWDPGAPLSELPLTWLALKLPRLRYLVIHLPPFRDKYHRTISCAVAQLNELEYIYWGGALPDDPRVLFKEMRATGQNALRTAIFSFPNVRGNQTRSIRRFDRTNEGKWDITRERESREWRPHWIDTLTDFLRLVSC